MCQDGSSFFLQCPWENLPKEWINHPLIHPSVHLWCRWRTWWSMCRGRVCAWERATRRLPSKGPGAVRSVTLTQERMLRCWMWTRPRSLHKFKPGVRMGREIWEVTLNRNCWSTGIFTQNLGFTENAEKMRSLMSDGFGGHKNLIDGRVVGLAHTRLVQVRTNQNDRDVSR